MNRNYYLIIAWICIILTLVLGMGTNSSKTMSAFGILFSVLALLSPPKEK